MTYEVITPSAARGIVEAILWKPAICWRVHLIAVLSDIRFATLKRNEVNSVASTRNAMSWMRGAPRTDYFADDDRAQRNSVILRDVDYRIEVSFEMTDRAGPEDNPTKFDEMFRRRLERGQYHMSPYLGCREFPAHVTPSRPDDPGPIPQDRELGYMLLDIRYGRPNRPVLFEARMIRGVVEVPSMEHSFGLQEVVS
jgi:CRISPR-associated protein Cas5d